MQNKYIWRYKSIIVFVQTENYTTTNYFLRSKCSLLQNCKQSNGSELMYILYRHFSAQIYRLMNCIHTGMCDCSLLKILDTFLLVTKTISLETPTPLRYTGFSDNVFNTKLLSCLMLHVWSRFCRIGLNFLFVESSALNGVAILHR